MVVTVGYQGLDDDELTLVPGMRLKVVPCNDGSGWWMGTAENGLFGVFPSNFVRRLDQPQPQPQRELQQPQRQPSPVNANIANLHIGLSSARFVKALFDYEAHEDDELSFNENDIIRLVQETDDGWWTGERNGQKGLFPANYVELLHAASAPAPAPPARPPPAECAICANELDELAFVSENCKHAPNTCTLCFRNNARIAMHGSNPGIVTCPFCDVRVTDDSDLRRLLTKQEFEELDMLRLHEYLRRQPNFSWCLTPLCGFGQLHEGGDESNIINCPMCNEQRCFTCNVRMHTGQTCAEFEVQRSSRLDVATVAYLQVHCKPCPRCEVMVYKDDGCDHMTCRPPGGCGHQYCWLCSADYEPIRRDGNHHHRPTCLHYRAVEPVEPNQG